MNEADAVKERAKTSFINVPQGKVTFKNRTILKPHVQLLKLGESPKFEASFQTPTISSKRRSTKFIAQEDFTLKIGALLNE